MLLALPEPPTAIFAANDIMAMATSRVAASLGLRVPDDLSVVGFDNIPESALNEPPLTTVEQPIQRMGYEAIGMLIALIAGRAGRHPAPDAAHQARRPAVVPGRSSEAPRMRQER